MIDWDKVESNITKSFVNTGILGEMMAKELSALAMNHVRHAHIIGPMKGEENEKCTEN